MAYISLFFAVDDTQVSAPPTLTNSVEFTLRADQNEVGDWVRLYALADTGYECTGVEVAIDDSTSVTQWQLAPDVDGSAGTPEAYGSPLTLGTVGDTTKVYFHVRAKASDTEDPVDDASVTLEVTGIAAAA